MEGYFWRLSDGRSGRVVVALCGVCTTSDGVWATVALAAHPGGFLRWADVAVARADADRLGVRVGDGVLTADADGLTVDLGPDARLDVRFAQRRDWPRRGLGGLGAAHLVPGLGQYWHPHLLGARVGGRATVGDVTLALDGWDAYAEKNWGRGGFPDRWWWGQAQGFERRDVCVAFAGGDLRIGPATVEATGLVVALGSDLVRLGNPLLAPVHARADGERWTLRARGPVWSVELDGRGRRGDAHLLPVPLPDRRHSILAAHEHLGAELRMVVRRRGAVVFAGESRLAGLEVGTRPDGEPPTRPG